MRSDVWSCRLSANARQMSLKSGSKLLIMEMSSMRGVMSSRWCSDKVTPNSFLIWSINSVDLDLI